MKVRVLISGRGYDAAANVPPAWELADGTTLDDLLDQIGRRLPAGRGLPPSCLVAVSGTHLGTVARHGPRELRDGDEVVLIAPVAGG
jgi:molybdopterin converting factor small subunit